MPATRHPIAVTIAVPTYHRPGDLAELLPMLLDQAARADPAQYAVSVLVVDNDPDASGREVSHRVGSGLIRYVVEPEPGISAVRNRAMDEAAAGLVAYIDDDERPNDVWLQDLLSTWSASGAAAVSGRVVAAFAGELDPWLDAGSFFRRRSMPTGTSIDLAAAGNLLLDLDQVLPTGIRFATDLGLTGGEDTLLSRQLHAAGLHMVWCDTSVVTDMVPRSRMTRRWVLTRAWSHGNTTTVVAVRLATSPAARLWVRARQTIGGVARIVAGLGRFAVGLLLRSDRHQARGLRMAFRGAGFVSGAFGLVYAEYARPAAA